MKSIALNIRRRSAPPSKKYLFPPDSQGDGERSEPPATGTVLSKYCENDTIALHQRKAELIVIYAKEVFALFYEGGALRRVDNTSIIALSPTEGGANSFRRAPRPAPPPPGGGGGEDPPQAKNLDVFRGQKKK
jgi:hypothetical protein